MTAPGPKVFINSPANGAVVGRTVVVSGRSPVFEPGFEFVVAEVRVTFGGGVEQTAPVTGTNWSCEVTAPSSVQPGQTVQIVAQAYGHEVGDTTLVPVGRPGTRDVVLDAAVPDLLTFDFFTSPVTTQPGRPHVLELSGRAADAQSGISKVELKIDDGPYVAVDDLVESTTPSDGRVWTWGKHAVQVFGDVQSLHRFTVRATDGAGNVIEAAAEIVVRLPFEAGPTEQAFGPTRYLSDLLAFARRYVEVDGSVPRLTPRMLARRFDQPFDRITEPARFEHVTAPVVQARIAVEVLRDRLEAPVLNSVGRRFRRLVYHTFLRGLGTSYDELRLARTPPARARLAERLGIGDVAVGPDRVGELTLAPDEITSARLAALFGYRSPTSGDPLEPGTGTAKVLLWRREALHERWRQEDAVQRDSLTDPRPVLDPDVVPEDHLRTRTPEDPAYRLWTLRQQWISNTLAEIAATGANARGLVRFDAVVERFVGVLDPPLATLGEQDADGVDVRPDLPQGLELGAFRFLARARALLADGSELDTEWDDVAAILLQVQKARQFQSWRTQERRASLLLDPASFTLDVTTPVGSTDTSRWRVRRSEYLEWRRTLATRATAVESLETGYHRAAESVEATVLPQLRDAIVAELAGADETSVAAAERLTRELSIDLRTEGGQRTTRIGQSLETLRGMLLSARNGSLRPDADGSRWTITVRVPDPGQPQPQPTLEFDREWAWMGSFRGWLSAMRVFAYPENQLLPALYVAEPGEMPRTPAFGKVIEALRAENRLTPEKAREILDIGVAGALDAAVSHPNELGIRDGLTDVELVGDTGDPDRPSLRTRSADMQGPDVPHRELFWLLPMAVAAKLQESGQFQAALDWYRIVFAYHLPPELRRIYAGLTAEDLTTSKYDREADWLLREVNPHAFAADRRNCYTKATIMAIAGCFTAFADDAFTRGSAEGSAQARTLYETAIDLLDLPEARPEADSPFPPNPVWESMRQRARSGLAKIHRGLDIAGFAAGGSGPEMVLPSQYRYSALVERAKNLVAIAQQVEGSYLSVLEQRDAKTYDELRASNDLEVASASVTLHVTKLAEALTGQRLASLQRQRAQLQEDHFTQLIDEGPNGWEESALVALGAAAYFQVAAGAAGAVVGGFKASLSGGLFGADDIVGSMSSFAQAAATGAQIAQIKASYERREQEWQLQRDLAAEDGAIADQQIVLADSQATLAQQEYGLSVLQQDHAIAVARFLATRFTNAELFEWMSGVLGRVYAYFLQQATALARLAEAQLAFERQELPAGFIGTDYWRDPTGDASAPDRRGLTGSARLLQDVTRLDQFAFETDRRKLHLTQTFALSQIAAFELQQFRETGVLTFATPQELFDRDFPGHYLRLVKRVKISLIALLPPVRGIRATLSTSGVSRVVVAQGPFDTATLRRQPESIAVTSPLNATGLFDLEPETGMLLPFEGMGVEAVWRLELPKPANPFDFRTIADVLITFEYTALASPEYRDRVVLELDRRFVGDRSFSIRNEFPDAWFELNNPDTVEPDRRMKVLLPLSAEDFPAHVTDLGVDQVSVFVVRRDELTDELTFTSLRHTIGGRTVSTEEVTTVGGIASTRRPGGAAWGVLRGLGPAGDWELDLRDDPVVRSWFTDELIEDLVLVLTVAGTTPDWP